MRMRWNRAFAVLTTVVVLGALANFVDARWVGDAYRSSALHLEDAASDEARIRAEIITTAVLLASPLTDVQERQLATQEESIRRDFAEASIGTRSGAARRLLE